MLIIISELAQNRIISFKFFCFNIKILSNAFNLSHLCDFYLISSSISLFLRDHNGTFLCYPFHHGVLYTFIFMIKYFFCVSINDNEINLPSSWLFITTERVALFPISVFKVFLNWPSETKFCPKLISYRVSKKQMLKNMKFRKYLGIYFLSLLPHSLYPYAKALKQ